MRTGGGELGRPKRKHPIQLLEGQGALSQTNQQQPNDSLLQSPRHTIKQLPYQPSRGSRFPSDQGPEYPPNRLRPLSRPVGRLTARNSHAKCVKSFSMKDSGGESCEASSALTTPDSGLESRAPSCRSGAGAGICRCFLWNCRWTRGKRSFRNSVLNMTGPDHLQNHY